MVSQDSSVQSQSSNACPGAPKKPRHTTANTSAGVSRRLNFGLHPMTRSSSGANVEQRDDPLYFAAALAKGGIPPHLSGNPLP